MDMITCKGEYRFEGFDLQGNKVSDVTYKNVLTQLFFTGLMKFLDQVVSNPGVGDMNLNYVATGTGTNPALKTNTLLQTEAFRKSIATKTIGLTTFTCKVSLDPADSNFTITEIGVFAAATGTVDSGTMVSRANVNIEKTSSIRYLITYTITMS